MIRIYGASDDLIEIHSDDESVFKSEEFYVENATGDGYVLALSDGTVLAINFDRFGTWRIVPIFSGYALSHIKYADIDEDSDIATLESDIKWVVFGTDMVMRAGR